MLSILAVMVLIVGTPTEPTDSSRAPHTGVFGSATVGGGTGLSAAYMALSATVVVDNWILTARSAASRRLEPGCSAFEWCTLVDSDEEQAYLFGRLFPRGSYMGRAALGVGAMTFTRGTNTGTPLACFLLCSGYSYTTSRARGLAWEAAIHLNGGSALVLAAQGNLNPSNSYAAVSIGFSLGRLWPGRVGGYASRERR